MCFVLSLQCQNRKTTKIVQLLNIANYEDKTHAYSFDNHDHHGYNHHDGTRPPHGSRDGLRTAQRNASRDAPQRPQTLRSRSGLSPQASSLRRTSRACCLRARARSGSQALPSSRLLSRRSRRCCGRSRCRNGIGSNDRESGLLKQLYSFYNANKKASRKLREAFCLFLKSAYSLLLPKKRSR